MMSPLELGAALITAVSIFLATRQHIAYWPTGIVSTLLYTYVYWEFRLYAEAGLQVVWLGLIAYGWYEWRRGGRDRGELPVSRTPRHLWLTIAASGFVTSGIVTFIQHRFTDNPAPLVDSSIAAWSIIAQWMTARKWLESWVLWTLINTAAVPLYLSRGLWSTAALYTALFILGIKGWFDWRRSLASA